MKLGVVSSALAGCGFEAGLDRLRDLGLGAIEIGCGGYHADRSFGHPARLLEGELDRWSEAIAERGLEISALAIHGAPLSPDRSSAFPPGNSDVLEWQWERRVVPYWREHGRIATDNRCFEMHPNDVVYNPRSFLRLRDAICARSATTERSRSSTRTST
jgi:hypothetical protein